MALDKSAVPSRRHCAKRQILWLIRRHTVAKEHIIESVHEERIEVEFVHIPVSVCPEPIEAPVSLPRARNGVSTASLEVRRRLTEESIQANLLTSEFWNFK